MVVCDPSTILFLEIISEHVPSWDIEQLILTVMEW